MRVILSEAKDLLLANARESRSFASLRMTSIKGSATPPISLP